MSTLPYWTQEDMTPHAQWPAMVEHLRRAHNQEPALVDRLYMQRPGHAPGQSPQGLLIWPAWQANKHLGVKVVTLFPDNQDKPNVQGVVLLFDAQDGSPVCALDGAALTLWKTAADAALGTLLLAREDARTLLMVGAGTLAPALIEAHLAIRPSLQQVLIWNRHADKAEVLAKSMAPRMPESIQVQAVTDIQNATERAHIICCATGSTQALVKGAWVQAGTHVNLVGGYTPEMRESDDDLMRLAKVYVDSRASTLAHCGDLTQAFAHRALTPSEVRGDLFDLCCERAAARQDAATITVFKSGGGAHLDLMMAQYFHRHCAESV
jgi:ornithine cyclodeaminase